MKTLSRLSLMGALALTFSYPALAGINYNQYQQQFLNQKETSSLEKQSCCEGSCPCCDQCNGCDSEQCSSK